MDGMKDVGGSAMGSMKDVGGSAMSVVPGQEETEEEKRARLHAAADRVQQAEWEGEIPSAVHKDLETIFSIVDTAGNGKLSKEEWVAAGLAEEVFAQIDRDGSGDIDFNELAFAADEDMFGDFGSAFSGGLGGISNMGSGLMDGMKDVGGSAMGSMKDVGGSAMSVVPGQEETEEEKRARLHAAADRV